jgi:two-component system cell cycle sensor histidine kinase/response regulator CckA
LSVYLPQARLLQGETYASKRPGTLRTGSGTILVVEDEDTVRHVTGVVLRRYGYEVISARDGETARQLVAEYSDPIDLLLTDVVMPGGINGLELATMLQTDRPNLKILYMSGYAEEIALGKNSIPAEQFLQKPFTPDELVARVQAILASNE